ncbi:hypothetical protein SAMN05444161_0349 [Rhizobiales bacterium GAS191]|jgi:hypothetical protein|nr:hypothetical protein SAMN05519103_07841 [Rhizobiales bacterium GAS113]SEC02440.1 hypothetical protein SAMN05444161_0349 [Rhizobiales bacterium GAS191]SED16662.1 hypothetical protein SAMN05519104_2941 [Rhizobiales bacterium GAS188]
MAHHAHDYMGGATWGEAVEFAASAAPSTGSSTLQSASRSPRHGRIRALALISALLLGSGLAGGSAFAEPGGEDHGDGYSEHAKVYALQRGEFCASPGGCGGAAVIPLTNSGYADYPGGAVDPYGRAPARPARRR